MSVKREKVDLKIEEEIVMAMVTSKDFLGQMSGALDIQLLQAKHLKQIAQWCSQYWEKYHKPPEKHIESIYNAWVRKGKAQEEVVSAIHDILENLSERYDTKDDFNVPYLVDAAGEYLNTRKIHVLKDEIEFALTEGDLAAAQSVITDYNSVGIGMGEACDPFENDSIWDLSFAESQKPLITWNSKVTDFFFGHALARDGLIGVLAPEKRGKTWWCVEFAMRAIAQRRKVALFEVGDMSQSQIMRRIGVRLSKRPMFPRDLGIIEVPRKLERIDKDINVETIQYGCSKVAGPIACKKASQRFLRGAGIKPGTKRLMISVHPNSSINITGIAGILETWRAQYGFVPDIIIIDYPDILAPEPGTGQYQSRDQINQTWKAMRRLSQENHCLVIAPTQANAASYDAATLGMGNFSEDKRKSAHVTGMLGLNQKSDEKLKGIMRLNWILLREGENNVESCLYVGQCLKLGRPYCCACM